MDAESISRSGNTYMGKLRSNFLGTKFKIYDTQPPHTYAHIPSPGHTSRRFSSKKVSPKVPTTGSYNVDQIAYEYNVLGNQCPRRMHCAMHSIPDIGVGSSEGEDCKTRPLVLKNRAPRWHKRLECWCLNFQGRVTVTSVKNFQLIAGATQPPVGPATATSSAQPDHEKIILQFGKVGKDMFTMDYRYPLSAFQAFAICLSSFGTKWACG